jgi:hypothetical protein
MKAKLIETFLVVFVVTLGLSVARADQAQQYPANATFTTVAITPFAIEGLTMDATGNFYTTGRQPDTNKKCPVWRIGPYGRKSVGFIPNSPACNPSGIAFDSVDLYIADGGEAAGIWKLTPDATGCDSDDSTAAVCRAIAGSSASSPSTPFASGVPGTNGLAFDKSGNLWTGDGTTGLGRVWKITGSGANCTPEPVTNCQEVLRIQPMNNGTSLGGTLSSGVGRVNSTIQAPTDATNPQNLVANGLGF